MKINGNNPLQQTHQAKEPHQAPQQLPKPEVEGPGEPRKVDDVQWSAELQEDQDQPQQAQASMAIAAAHQTNDVQSAQMVEKSNGSQEIKGLDDGLRSSQRRSTLEKTQVVQEMQANAKQPKGAEPNPSPPQGMTESAAVQASRKVEQELKPVQDSNGGQQSSFHHDRPQAPPDRQEYIERLKSTFAAKAS